MNKNGASEFLLFFQAIRIKPLTYQEQGLASFPCAPLNLLGRSGVGIILSHCEKRRQQKFNIIND